MTGKDLYYNKDYKKSIFLLKHELKCLKFNKANRISGLFHLGSCYYQLNKLDTAIKYYNYVIELSNVSSDFSDSMVAITRGMCFAQLGLIYKEYKNYEKSEECFFYGLCYSVMYKKLSKNYDFIGDKICQKALFKIKELKETLT